VSPRPARRLVGVLALQGDFREHMATLRALEVESRPVRLRSDLDEVDALILPGGESTTMTRLMEPGLRQAIVERSASGMPVLGTCAGMILMASRILDGRLDQEPLGLMDMTIKRNAYGRQIDSFEAEVESNAIGGRGPAVFIRAPQVMEPLELGEVLAVHAGLTVALRQGSRLALAFHPELTSELRWHQYFLGLGANGS
jgi:pyridoxal 5'-phosphate synthase pdxT subunit